MHYLSPNQIKPNYSYVNLERRQPLTLSFMQIYVLCVKNTISRSKKIFPWHLHSTNIACSTFKHKLSAKPAAFEAFNI